MCIRDRQAFGLSLLIYKGNQRAPEDFSFADLNKKIEVQDIMENRQNLNGLTDGYDNRSRAFIEIQNGCDHRCTFCIIPFGRGNSISKSVKNIINEINLMIEKGHKEIVLTGVDIASWGHDLDKKSNLGLLVKKILRGSPDLTRLKLSSMDVIGFDDELLEIIATDERILPHIHLSLQAGDNMILKRMKRRHSRDDAINLCKKIRKRRPEVAFGADIITGFPTETEEMFLNTLNIVDECGLDWLHVFPYSPRPGTPAAKMPQNDKKVSKQRAKILREKGEKIKKNHLEGLVGKKIEVFIFETSIAHPYPKHPNTSQHLLQNLLSKTHQMMRNKIIALRFAAPNWLYL